MPYGIIKVDTVTFTDNGVDKNISLSGLIQNPTFTGNVTATGTIYGDVIRGGTTISGVTITGTIANFASGVFTTQLSGTTGTFNSLTGTTATFTSGIIASGTAALPSLAILSDPNTGLFSPGPDQLAISTSGVQSLLITSSGTLTLPNDATINSVRVGRGLGNTSTNTVVGNLVFTQNIGSSSNTAIGYQALYSNTTGSLNTAIGGGAMGNNLTASYNTAIGVSSLVSNTTGAANTAIGVSSLYSNTTGTNNTAIGYEAGYGGGSNSNTTGDNNTFIGKGSTGASSSASDVITLGNSSIATLRAQVTTITALSDKRDKKNIAPLNAGLDFLTKLRPVSFTWNTRDKAKVDIEDTGFIAQELLAVQEDTGITIPNLVSQENPNKLEAGYGTLIPVLVSAVQELTAMVKQLQDEITTLKRNS